MSNDWRKKLKGFLEDGMRYCFHPNSQGSFPELNPIEFYGEESSSGYLDLLASFVNDLRKKAYQEGFSKGVLAKEKGFTPNGQEDSIELVPELVSLAAERSWLESEKES